MADCKEFLLLHLLLFVFTLPAAVNGIFGAGFPGGGCGCGGGCGGGAILPPLPPPAPLCPPVLPPLPPPLPLPPLPPLFPPPTQCCGGGGPRPPPPPPPSCGGPGGLCPPQPLPASYVGTSLPQRVGVPEAPPPPQPLPPPPPSPPRPVYVTQPQIAPVALPPPPPQQALPPMGVYQPPPQPSPFHPRYATGPPEGRYVIAPPPLPPPQSPQYALHPPSQPQSPYNPYQSFTTRERLLIESGQLQPSQRAPFDPFVVVAGEDPRASLPSTAHSMNPAVRNVSKSSSSSSGSEPATTESSASSSSTDTSANEQSDQPSVLIADSRPPATYSRIHHPIVYSLPLGGPSSSYRKTLLERGCLNRSGAQRVLGNNAANVALVEAAPTLLLPSTGRPLSLPPLNNGCLGGEDGKACKERVIRPEGGVQKQSENSSNVECSSTALRLVMVKYANRLTSDAKLDIQRDAERQLADGAYHVFCTRAHSTSASDEGTDDFQLDFVSRASVFCTVAVVDGMCYAFRSNPI